MKRRFTILTAALALLTFLTVPMGMWGQTATYSLTPDQSSTGSSATTYITTLTEFTHNSITWKMNQWNPSNLQIKTNQSSAASEFRFYNTSAIPGRITQVVITFSALTVNDASKLMFIGGTSEVSSTTGGIAGTWNGTDKTLTWTPAASDNFTYFAFYQNGKAASGTNYLASSNAIVVTYETGGGISTTTTITVPTDFNTDVYTSTEAGQLTATVTYDNNGTTTNVPNATVAWSSSNENVATIDEDGVVTLVAAGNTNITATFAGNDDYYASYDTYELTVTNSDPNVPGTANNPYMAAAIIAMGSELPSGTVYVRGIVSRFEDENILGDGNAHRYYISNDGSTTNGEIRVYKGKGLNNEAFANADDVLVGDNVVICGVLSRYNNMTQFNQDNYIYSLTRPASYTLTVSSLSHAEMYVFAGNESEMLFEGEGSGSVVEGASVILSVEPENGYELTSLMVDGVNHVNDINAGAYVFNMPSHDVEVTVTTTRLPYYTVNFTTNGIVDCSIEVTQGQSIATLPTATAEYIPNGYTFVGWYTTDYQDVGVAPQFVTAPYTPNADVTLKAVFAVATGTPASLTKMTSSDNFTAGDNVVIVAVGQDYAFAMYQQTKSNSYVDKYAFDGNAATVAADNKNWLTVSVGSTSGTWKLGDATNGHVYTSGSNNLAISTEESTDFTLAWDVNKGKFTLVGNSRWLSYRDDLSSNNYFRMGGATNGNASGNIYFDIYKYVAGSASYSNYKTSLTEQYQLNVQGYNGDGGYCLIASPVYVSPSAVAGMTEGDFDLYYFDNNQDLEWRNYEATSFNLEPGKGYLYAKKATTENPTYSFELAGTPYNGNGEIELTQGTGNWADWNLVGNPYGVDAEIYNDCYVMNGNGSGIIPAENQIVPAMHGVFVKYAEGEKVAIFEPIDGDGITSVQSENRLVLNLVRNRGTVIDRAIVRFGEGRQMTKFTLFENSTKLYIPQDDEDYAIVRSEAQGELPISFRASENGTYTLSMNVENVDMNYLHLIDNKTGNDVDLLQTPSYTFEANTNDYANRFMLVFAANGTDEADESSFAFFSNGNLIVNNEGNATLQVIDINGRILSSETISGSCSKAINATTGVYMLRLINGDNVKVQKVVVR